MSTKKIVLIVLGCVIALAAIICFTIYFFISSFSNLSDVEEYTLGDDTISSIKSVVEKRKVTSVYTGIKNGITTKTVEYKSDSVQDDLIKYVEYLRTDAGFSLIKEMDLSVVPSTVQLAKESVDEGQVIIIIIDYTLNGYTIKLNKGEGTLTTL